MVIVKYERFFLSRPLSLSISRLLLNIFRELVDVPDFEAIEAQHVFIEGSCLNAQCAFETILLLVYFGDELIYVYETICVIIYT